MAVLGYKGTVTTTGTSEAIRFEKSLFRQHPEFRQKAGVEAHVIGPGTLLVRVTDEQAIAQDQEDPIVLAFLSFLESDATAHPERIVPLSSSNVARALELTKDVIVSDNELLPDDVTF